MNVLTSITVLGFLIFFHEMGHFLAAILQGIYVDGFSIGFGPSIIQKKYKDITYSFRAFPLGGFVSFPDEELNNIDPKDPNLLKNRPIFQRAIVISAGVSGWILIPQYGVMGAAWASVFGCCIMLSFAKLLCGDVDRLSDGLAILSVVICYLLSINSMLAVIGLAALIPAKKSIRLLLSGHAQTQEE